MAEQAYAYVTLIPVAKGFQSAISNELDGVGGDAAGAKIGGQVKGGFGKAVSGFVGPILTGLATVGAVKFASGAVTAASDLQEVGSAVKTVFGEGATTLQKFAENSAITMGLSKTQFLEGAKTFGVFGNAAGLAGEANATFSKDLLTLAGDFASFNNVPTDQAVSAIGAALRGETEPIRAFGIMLDDASVKAKAMAMGLYDGKGAMDAQAKTLATQALIMEQAGVQQGDFARTSDGLANSQRILQASFADMQATVGQALVPVMASLAQTLVPIVNQLAPVLADLFQRLAPVISQLAGLLPGLITALMPIIPVLAEVIAVAGELLAMILPPLVKIISALIPPVLSVVKALMPLVPVALEIVKALMPLIDLVLPLLVGLIQALVPVIKFIAEVIKNVLIVAISILVGTFKTLGTVIGTIGKIFSDVFNGIVKVAKVIINVIISMIEGFINGFLGGINLLIKSINTVLSAGKVIGIDLSINEIPKVKLPRLAKGGYVDSPTTALIGEAGPEVVTPLSEFKKMVGLDGDGPAGKTLNYYAAPNESIDKEEALFKAMRRAKVVANW